MVWSGGTCCSLISGAHPINTKTTPRQTDKENEKLDCNLQAYSNFSIATNHPATMTLSNSIQIYQDDKTTPRLHAATLYNQLTDDTVQPHLTVFVIKI